MNGNDPKDMWAQLVPIAERSPTDFQGRRMTYAIYDPSAQYRRVAELLASTWGLTWSEAADRAIRIYVAHCLDTLDTLDLRVEHDQTVLVPPPQWVEHNRDEWGVEAVMPSADPVDDAGNRQFAPTVPVAVNEMVATLVGEYDVCETKSGFGKAALCFVGDIEPRHDDDISVVGR
jgi:hypothetical protein